MKLEEIECPSFAWIVMIVLGCLDLYRGFSHTVLLEHAAYNVFVIDTSGGIENQIFLLGLFGITNYLTGIIYILIGLSARHLVPILLPIIPSVYLFGSKLISLVTTPTAALGGQLFMNLYMVVCYLTFIGILIVNFRVRRKMS
jgi:hypothetical protein